MILTIDIGNSNITLGGFDSDELRFICRLSTDCAATEDEYAFRILSVLRLHAVQHTDITDVIVSSVVPPINTAIKRAVEFLFQTTPLFVGPGMKTGLGIQCDMPSSVGADLICACVGANAEYGNPVLIVDIGTATKMMVVNKNNAFIGATIMPGVYMGANALAERTAQLPNVDLRQPNCVIAKNTVDCIQSGIIYGHASMIDGMIDRVMEEFGQALTVCVTGGLASLILPHCRHDMILDEHLILKGLHIIYQKNK